MNSVIPAPFRSDLKLYPGPKEVDGQPTYNLYDPLTAKYYKLGWVESVIYKLARSGMSFADISEEVNKNSTFLLTEEDIASFYHQSALLGLLDIPKASQEVMKESEKNKSSTLWWVLMHYLYFRIPLFKPDAFLEHTLKFAKVFWSPLAIAFYVIATIGGCAAIVMHYEEYFHTLTTFFNFEGAIMYAITICCLKIVHELAHAYTAKNYQIQVPSIGIAVIVLWPVLYTDVTDSWKLANRKERLAISIAGVAAELVIAGLSSLGWFLTSPGTMHTIFFLLSSTTWITSLFINFNPAMRFDGYYILCDLWGIDNLRARAFTLARWKVHEWMFGFGRNCPEDLSLKRIRGMVAYSLFTWVYLLILYTAIAVFVYYQFAKALGIILFLLEIGIFFVWPVVTEFKELYKLKTLFRLNMRTITTLTLVFLAMLWLLLPLNHHEYIPSITIPEQEQILYAVDEGKIERIFFKQGDEVRSGQTIIEMTQNKLEKEIAKKMEEKKLLERVIEIDSLTPDQHSNIPSTKMELLSLIDQIKELTAAKQYLMINALMDGTLYSFDDTLKPGQPVGKNQILGRIADTKKIALVAFVPEKWARFIHPDQLVSFSLPDSFHQYRGVVNSIESVPASTLEYPVLASKYKGPLAVTADMHALRLVDSYFKARITLEVDPEHPLLFGKSGNTVVITSRESLLMRGLSYLRGLILQESSL